MSHEKVHYRTICNSEHATSSLENMSSRGFRVATTVAGVVATTVLAGCASDAPQDTGNRPVQTLKRSKICSGQSSSRPALSASL